MTAVVAIIDSNSDVYMGGDAAGVAGWDLNTRKNEKVFHNGPYIMGSAGSTRVGNLLQHTFKPPPPPSIPRDMFPFMVNEFIDELRGSLKEAGVAAKDKEVESGGLLLVGVNGRIFRIDTDYQVGESIKPYSAIGCGSPQAMGALYALCSFAGLGLTPPRHPVDFLYTALEAAEEHNIGVRGPFHFVTTAKGGLTGVPPYASTG